MAQGTRSRASLVNKSFIGKDGVDDIHIYWIITSFTDDDLKFTSLRSNEQKLQKYQEYDSGSQKRRVIYVEKLD